jgi:Na+/glutamate symporter
MANQTLADYPQIVNVMWTCFGLLVGFIAGALFGRWRTIQEADASNHLSEEEMTLVNAERHRRQREKLSIMSSNAID